MKTHVSSVMALVGGIALCAAPLGAQVTLLSDNFSDGLRVGASRPAQWYSAQASTSGTGNALIADANFSGGNAVRFYSSSANNALITNFSTVTLASAGDYIQISAKVRYTDSRIAASSSTGAMVGLFNSGGTALAADAFGSANYSGVLGDDIGYRGANYATTGTSDMRLLSQNPVGGTSFFNNWHGTLMESESSGLTVAQNTLYTVTLRIELAANLTDLNFDYTFSGGSGPTTYTQSFSAAALSTTFDQAVLMAYSGQSGYDARMGDVLVTSNIPEPSASAVLGGLGVLGLAAMRRRRHHC